MIFSFVIIILLWLLQVVSLKSYYELSVKKEIDKVAKKVEKKYNDDNYEEYFNKLSFNTDMCIELYEGTNRKYYSFSCNAKSIETSREKLDFVLKKYDSQGYEIDDQKLNNKTFLYGIKLPNNQYAFIQASLVPVDSTVKILKEQILIISIIASIISLILAGLISKKISKPIETINENAKKIVYGKYDVELNKSTIREINELNETLNYTSKELEKTEKLRNELISNVSHDLKTPLTMIKAYAELVKDINYKNKTKREENLNVIIKESDRLNLLVNDILDLSKYQANTIKLEYSEFDINLMIKEIIKRFEIYEVKDNYKIEYNLKNEKYVIADPKRIEQVIYNLIGNALNYTGEDKKIFINVIDKKENDSILIEIKDTGKGIEEKDLDLIWNKYYKVDKTYSRVQIGSGIGLSIVKSILELHKVKYGVESKKNKGTTFYFELIRSDKNK